MINDNKVQPHSRLRRFVFGSVLACVAATDAFAATNKLQNGNFNAGLTGWACTASNGAAATCAVEAGAYRVNITNGGTATWHVQPAQINVSLTQGQVYTFAFDARSDAGRTSQIKVERAVAPYEDFSQTGAGQALTTTMKRFSYTFTASATLANARVVLNVGNNAADVFIDNVWLVDGNVDACAGVVGCPNGGNNVIPTTSTIQAEDFTTYFDTTTGNTGGAYRLNDNVDIQATTDTGGGYNVGWSENGEWLGYNVQLPAGTYDVTARIASAVGGSVSVKVGQTAATITGAVANTGGWQNWADLKVGTVTLTSTATSAYLNFLSSSVNLNWIKFSPACTSNCPVTPITGITAKQAAAGMGKGFNLGQMFDNAQASTSLATASAKIDAYYNKGFRNVRIPTTWTASINGYTLASVATGAITPNTGRLNDLTKVIDYALSKPGMYVILNAHHEVDLKEYNKAYVLEKLWTDISAMYKNRDHRLIFEILNEPHLLNGGPMPAANLRNMTSLAYKKIRADDAARIIAIGGNQWFASGEMAATWPNLDQVGGGNDAYIMAEFHHYEPWTFSGDSQGDYTDNWNDGNVYGPMDVMLAWANTVGKGMPVFIGEWGVGWGSRYATMSCNNIRSWYTKLGSQYAPAKGMPTSLWDDGGWFKVWDYEAKVFSNNLADCISGTCAWEGNDRNGPNCY